MGSIGPLIDISQILNILFMINLSIPTITSTVYGKMNMISNINLKFAFTSPLTSLKVVNPFKYPNTSRPYQNLLFESYSFIYNVQSQLVMVLLVAIIFAMIKKLNEALKSKEKCVKFNDKVTSFLEDTKHMFHEIYYTQRLYIHFCFFQFVDQLNINHYLQYLFSFLIIEFVTIVAFFIIEIGMLIRWYNYIYADHNLNKESLLSIQSECENAVNKKGIQEFQTLLLFIQTIVPMVLTLVHNEWAQLMLCGALFLGMSVQIIARVKFASCGKLMACYCGYYLSLFSFCLCWGVTNLFYGVESNNISGWIMCLFLFGPTVFSVTLLLPKSVAEMGKSVKLLCIKLRIRCRKRDRRS